MVYAALLQSLRAGWYVGPEKFVKNDKRRACTKCMLKKKHLIYSKAMEKLNKYRAFNNNIGPGKNSKISKHRAFFYSGL